MKERYKARNGEVLEDGVPMTCAGIVTALNKGEAWKMKCRLLIHRPKIAAQLSEASQIFRKLEFMNSSTNIHNVESCMCSVCVESRLNSAKGRREGPKYNCDEGRDCNSSPSCAMLRKTCYPNPELKASYSCAAAHPILYKDLRVVMARMCKGTGHGSCKGPVMCDPTNPCFSEFKK
jgi:hypothetical protein